MEWYWLLLIFFAGLFAMMLTGLPIAFSFLAVFLVAAFFILGGEAGLTQITLSIFSQLTRYIWMPFILFMLMGEVIFHSKLGPDIIGALDMWLGRLPGRLGLLAVGSGTALSTLTGTSMASTAILGTTLVPEFEKRGYKKTMSLGPILGSGGLAMMVPPSGMAVYVAVLAEASIGGVLMGIIIPGLMMATLYATYIVLRSYLQPSIAPPYHVPPTPLSKKLQASATYLLPIGIIIFLVIGVILLGIATPSEAAATGAVGTYLLAALHGRLNWELIKQSLKGTLKLSVMIFMIATGAIIFGQLLSLSGSARGLAKFLVALPVHPIVIFISIQLFGFLLGMFLTPAGVVTLVIPTFLVALRSLGFDLVWFSVVLVLNAEMATTSPPFGPSLYVLKGVAPEGTTLGDCYKAALPFLGCDLIVMTVLIIFPSVVLWLPQVMR